MWEGHGIDTSNYSNYIERNLLFVKIYFRELNFEVTEELPKYTVKIHTLNQ